MATFRRRRSRRLQPRRKAGNRSSMLSRPAPQQNRAAAQQYRSVPQASAPRISLGSGDARVGFRDGASHVGVAHLAAASEALEAPAAVLSVGVAVLAVAKVVADKRVPAQLVWKRRAFHDPPAHWFCGCRAKDLNLSEGPSRLPSVANCSSKQNRQMIGPQGVG